MKHRIGLALTCLHVSAVLAVAGLVIFVMYVPSLFLPLGGLGLWGLLEPASGAELGIGGRPAGNSS